MSVSKRIAMAAAATALLATTACITDPNTGERRISKAAIGGALGAVGGYFAGDLIGGKHDRTEKIVGAGIGAIAGGAAGAYMDKQEQELRRKTAGTGVEVERNGNELVLNMPSGVTFATNSYAIQPQFQTTLNEVAQTLAAYPSTYIDIYGHTDSTGGD
ncbi:MAG TPA: glycine zipper domain-containing protein, partial [Allosphingosinicella sp.]